MTGQIKLKGTPGNFTETDFTATKFATTEEKARIANKLIRFILGGFNRYSFSKAMYTRLSNMYGHIAHYDIHGFYETWFSGSKERQSTCCEAGHTAVSAARPTPGPTSKKP